MDTTKPIWKSRTLAVLALALIGPVLLQLVGLNIPLGDLQSPFTDDVFTLGEMINLAGLVLAAVFRGVATKALYVFQPRRR